MALSGIRRKISDISRSPSERYVEVLRDYGYQARILEQTGGVAFNIMGFQSDALEAAIEVDNCPIKLIAVQGNWLGGGESGPDYYLNTHFLIPEPRLTQSPLGGNQVVRLKTVRKKSIPVIGRVNRMEWRCAGLSRNTLEALNSHGADPWLLLISKFAISLHLGHGYWILTCPRRSSWHFPPQTEWEASLKLASILRQVPLALHE